MNSNTISLDGRSAAMVNNGSLTIFESQQEYEGENGTISAVTPAKSIWFNIQQAKKLRDFLNEQYPIEV